MRTAPALLPILLGLLCLPGGAAALAPSDLCTGNPCVIRGTAILEGGTLDFGAETDVRLSRTAVLRFGAARDDVDAWLELLARSFVLEKGARIQGRVRQRPEGGRWRQLEIHAWGARSRWSRAHESTCAAVTSPGW